MIPFVIFKDVDPSFTLILSDKKSECVVTVTKENQKV